MDVNSSLSVINRSNSPIKRERSRDWIKKYIVKIHAVYRRFTLDPIIFSRLKVKKWKKVFRANSSQKRAG